MGAATGPLFESWTAVGRTGPASSIALMLV